MNVHVVGRIRPSSAGDTSHSLNIEGQHRLVTSHAGAGFNFQHLHRPEASNIALYNKSVSPLVELLVGGYNASLLVVGETHSGKSLVTLGNGGDQPGLVALMLEDLFTKIRSDDRYMFDSHVSSSNRVTMQVYEIYNELVRDLTLVPGLQPQYLELDETPARGTHVANLRSVAVSNAAEGITQFRQACQRRTDKATDFGPSRNYVTTVAHLDLELQTPDSRLPHKSRFTLVVTPGAEKLADDAQQLRLREGVSLNKSLLSFTQLAAALANQTFPDRIINYSDSKLTNLLRDELGGNCNTRVLMCLRPHTDTHLLSILLTLANQLAAIQNYPVLNDPFSQNLLVQYRTLVQHLKQHLGYMPGLAASSNMDEKQEELRRVQADNISLRDQNERLHHKLNQLQGKFGTLASTKTDLSAQLLMTEEEKLQVSKTLVDMEIQNNKLKEEKEAAKFELTNKILSLENELMEMDVDRDKHVRAAAAAKERLAALEKDRKNLADEFIVLKADHQAVREAHIREVQKSEELSVELLNLVNAKAALLQRLQRLESSRGPVDSPSVEVDRVKAIISRHSTRENGDVRGTAQDRDDLHRNLFGSQRQLEEEMEDMRMHHEDDARRFNDKISALQKEMQEARQQARERQRANADLNVQLLSLKHANNELQNQSNRAQHKMKDVNDDFRSRLEKYVEDITNFMDSSPAGQQKGSNLRAYVDKMLEDLRRAHKLRETQLSQAAKDYRERMVNTVHKHEHLLVAYRDLRQQIQENRVSGVDLGPDVSDLEIADADLSSQQQQEIRRLQEQLSQTQAELDRHRYTLTPSQNGGPVTRSAPNVSPRKETLDSFQRQVRQFAMTTQQDLEVERAQLLTRIALLEGENEQLQTYIDQHLVRYKDEIFRLRDLVGDQDPGGFTSPPLRTGKQAPKRY